MNFEGEEGGDKVWPACEISRCPMEQVPLLLLFTDEKRGHEAAGWPASGHRAGNGSTTVCTRQPGSVSALTP